jgi:hypothetical protein
MIERAYYAATIQAFLTASESQILGELAKSHHFALEIFQKAAWINQIAILKDQLRVFPQCDIFFEFSIPRMGKRVDALLIVDGIVFVVEFKVGADGHARSGLNQVMDYALDLKNFHEGSHTRFIVPILVSTKAVAQRNPIEWSSDNVLFPLLSHGKDLREVIGEALSTIPAQAKMDVYRWATSGYKPTPTIVEAAQALYRQHSVEEISRSDAGAINLTETTKCISEIIESSKKHQRKSICFVTGVPGAGKTLAGLNIAVQRLQPNEEEHAVFLSGNGPLVIVLREALARDKVERAKEKGNFLSKRDAAAEISAFIQNIHHFRDEALGPRCRTDRACSCV